MRKMFVGSSLQKTEGFQHEFYKFVLENKGFDPYWLDYKKKKRFFLKLALKKPETIWCEDGERGGVVLFAMKFPFTRIKKSKIITRFHRVPSMEIREKGFYSLLALLESDKVVWNYDCKEELKKLFPLFDFSKFGVVHNGVDIYHFRLRDMKRDWKKILFIGGIWENKRLELLIESLQYLPKHRLLVGGNYVNERYARKINKLYETLDGDIKRRIIYLGFVNYWEKPLLMATCGVFVMPSKVESWSTQTMEAMSCGSPVLITEGGGVNEYVPEDQRLPVGITPEELAERIKQSTDYVFGDGRIDNRSLVYPYHWSEIRKEVEEVLEDG